VTYLVLQGLEYRWVQTGRLSAAGPLTAISWNLEGTRLLTGGALLQLWHQSSSHEDEQGMVIAMCRREQVGFIYFSL